MEKLEEFMSQKGCWEFLDRTTDALLMGINEPIVYDLKIPALNHLHFSVGYAMANCISNDSLSVDEFKRKNQGANFNSTLEKFIETSDWTQRTKESLFSLLYVTYSTGYEGNGAEHPFLAKIIGQKNLLLQNNFQNGKEMASFHVMYWTCLIKVDLL